MKKWVYLFSTAIFSVFCVQIAGCATKQLPPAPVAEEKTEIEETTQSTVFKVSDINSLINAISVDGAHIIIDCPIDLGGQSLSLADSITLEGEVNAVLFNGNIRTADALNVKIKELTFWGCPITFFGNCQSVLIKNCTFSSDENATESTLTISKGVGIEISHCVFLGDEDDIAPIVVFGSREIIASECQIQLHHSSFSANAALQSKAAMMHIYDCHFAFPESEQNKYLLSLGTSSQLIIESCSFYAPEKPFLCYADSSATPFAGTFSHIFQHKCAPEILQEMCFYDRGDALKSFKLHLSPKKMWDIPYKYDLVHLLDYESKIGH